MVLGHFWERRVSSLGAAVVCAALMSVCLVPMAQGAVDLPKCETGPGSGRPVDVYVPMDSWVYPALDRLHGLGYLDTAFLGLRSWTDRKSTRLNSSHLGISYA